MMRGGRSEYTHLIVRPLQFIHEIQTAVYDEWVHVPRFLTEARDAITALFGCTEFELEDRLVVGIYYAEVV